MIRARMGPTAIVGLTDVNVFRLQGGRPIRLKLAELGPEDGDPPEEIVIFHATREAILRLAESTGTDPKDLLDQLGEG